MKRARGQEDGGEYCPINLDYIFDEDDPLLPWLEQREKEIEVANSEEENFPELVRETVRSDFIPESREDPDSSEATKSDCGDSPDDDDGDDSHGGGNIGYGRQSQDTIVPSTYPYDQPGSSSQAQHTTDRGKSPLVNYEEDSGDEEEKDEGEVSRDYDHRYGQGQYYEQYPPPPPPPAHSYGSFFSYPPPLQYGYEYGNYGQQVYEDTSNQGQGNDDNDQYDAPRHSFWW